MSDFFLEEFKKRVGCQACKTSKLTIGKKVYSLCAMHLNIAAEKWRCWSEIRRAEGLCISCNRHGFNGWLRCRLHTTQNRVKCRKWSEANKQHNHDRWIQRVETFVNAGFCVCRARTPLTDGFRRCRDCRAKRPAKEFPEVQG